MTRAEQILRFIESKDGVTYTEILKFIHKEFWNIEYNWRRDRGMYATGLIHHKGLLRTFCEKRFGKWYLVSPIASPFYPNTFKYSKSEIFYMRKKNILKQQMELI